MLVDRETEVDQITSITKNHSSSILLLYGRRRVGKTFLLNHIWQEQRVFYYLAADEPVEMNREEMLREFSRWTGQAYDSAAHPTWKSLFRLLLDYSRNNPLIVVLDEFQYLMNAGSDEEDVISRFVSVWDRRSEDARIHFVFCGSQVSMMKSLQEGDQPLYGRIQWSQKLVPFDYYEAAEMVPDRSPREQCMIYGAYGGMPDYLRMISKNSTFSEHIQTNFLNPSGGVHLRVKHILDQEKGIRKTEDYRAVLTAIASGATKINDIAQKAGLKEDKRTARRAIETLMDLDLVARERNIDAGEKAPYRHYVSDNAVLFNYRFIHQNRSLLEQGEQQTVWEERIRPSLNRYMGFVFEKICREAYLNFHDRWQFPAFRSWNRWVGKDQNRRSIEVDVVSRLADDRMLTGEVKWSSDPVGKRIHWELMRDLEDLSHSGRNWAREAMDESGSRGHIYFSAAGFTEGFQELAEQNERIRLFDLKDLFPV